MNLKAMTSTSSTSLWALLIIVVHQLWREVFHIKKYTFFSKFKVLHFISTNSYLSVQKDKEHAAFHFISAPRGSFPKLRGIFIVFVRQRTPGWGELTEAVERGEIKLTQKCFQLGITLLWWEKKTTACLGPAVGFCIHKCTHLQLCLGVSLVFFFFF